MKRYLVVLMMSLMIPFALYAQEAEEEQSEVQQFSGVNDIAKKEHIANKKYIPYAYVREADVMWSKTIWRMIDLREKINLPIYYPTQPIGDRRSFMSVVMDAIQAGDLVAYAPGLSDEFEMRMSNKDIQANMGAGVDSTYVRDPETGLEKLVVVTSEANSFDVMKLLLKEVWYFDKKYSRMDVRIIGVCPIIEKESEDGSRVDLKQAFWVYYPELRPFIAKQEVYNTKNDAQRDSYDDLFAERRFSGYVFRESNVYNNRNITDYTAGMESTLEAERIRNELFVKEHDLWEY